jgi:hypothetical protein
MIEQELTLAAELDLRECMLQLMKKSKATSLSTYCAYTGPLLNNHRPDSLLRPIRHHEKKDSPKDKTTDNLTFIVAHFEGRSCQRLTPNLAACSAPSTSACSDLHKTTKHKLVRKRGYVDLRGQTLA